MDRKGAIISILGALGTLVTILGASGAKAIEALAGVPLMLRAWSDGLPLGLLSFGLALALATLVWAVSIRVFPVGKCGKAPFGLSNLMAFMIGPSVTLAQQLVAPNQAKGALLTALILGLIAGLTAILIGPMFRGKARVKPEEAA